MTKSWTKRNKATWLDGLCGEQCPNRKRHEVQCPGPQHGSGTIECDRPCRQPEGHEGPCVCPQCRPYDRVTGIFIGVAT